ncbi:MAG: hypothetical protein C4518_07550 [Desulfobacteraceae bacterium]|nr:MAG: hypothetical protein C4518_07550 [Desulfobacteraceae bacterium]
MKKSTYFLQGLLLLILCSTPVNGISEERLIGFDQAWTDIRHIPAMEEPGTAPEPDAGLAVDPSTKTVYPNLFSSDAGSNGFDVALNSCEGPPAKSESDKDCL